MKYLYLALCLTVFACVGSSARGEHRPNAAMTFRVSDDFGRPVEGATVAVSTFHHWQPGDGFGKDITEIFTGITDAKGEVTIVGRSGRGDFSYNLRPLTGYYGGGGGEYKFRSAADGKWQPWKPTIDILVKPILKPIPMYARKVGVPQAVQIPQSGEPIGFDLVVSDWIAPHGKGTTADVVFKLDRRYTTADEPFEATLTVTFSNEGDGIQSAFSAPFTGSQLKLPRYAPEHGYAPELVKRKARPAAGKPVEDTSREDQNYFFRVRTVLDEKNQVKSALYGKIYGDIQFWANGKLRFTYYLNPEAGDRNMEFDVERNLLGQLSELQRPSLP